MSNSSENIIEVLEDDDSWVFESLVNFLHGPIWKLPVISFIEDKSVVFDPDSFKNMSAEKEQEYKKIHEEYKGLVDFMLANFMEDIQVSPEQVEKACRTREGDKPQVQSNVTKIALEQLWAAEDFNAFRRLMTRKNIDLQLQSLELLVAKYGVLSPSLRNLDSTDEQGGDNEEEEFLQVVIRQIQQQELQDNSNPTKVTASSSTKALPIKSTMSKLTDETFPASANEIKSDAPEQYLRRLEVKRTLGSREAEKVVDSSNITNVPVGSGSEEDIQKRREYMRAQRDKLVELKRIDREKQLTNGSENTTEYMKSRPKSAKAAQTALTSVHEVASNERSMAARKALANRLKQELNEK